MSNYAAVSTELPTHPRGHGAAALRCLLLAGNLGTYLISIPFDIQPWKPSHMWEYGQAPQLRGAAAVSLEEPPLDGLSVNSGGLMYDDRAPGHCWWNLADR